MTWTRIGCTARDVLMATASPALIPMGGHVRVDGLYGPPRIETVWGTDAGTELLKDVRHPRHSSDPGDGDRLPCEHYEWEKEDPGNVTTR
jgi:hypothetical protein